MTRSPSLLLSFGLLALAAAAQAQDNQAAGESVVGPRELKDFSLPGQRTSPAAPAPAPQAAPAVPTPAPPAAIETAPRPSAASPRARPVPVAEGLAIPSPPAAESVPAPITELPTTDSQPALPDVTPLPAPASTAWFETWWPAAAALLVALLGFAGARRWLRSRRKSPEIRLELAPALPVTAPAQPRARLALSLAAEKAVANDESAAVHYAITLANQGEEAARNIRIDTRMFNAGAEPEIKAFLDGAIHEQSGSPQITIPPGKTMELRSEIAMPRSEVAGIAIEGRSLFVPVVAINVAYDWTDGGGGRTSRSWLIGRDSGNDDTRMGPLRLDLGPRIWRSLGQRETELANVA